MSGTAAADHGSPVYLLKSHYQQQRKALDDAFRAERLNRWYDIQRRQLVYRPVFGGPKICQDAACPPPAFGAPSGPHVLPNPQTPSYGYESEYHEERSTPGTEVIVPESQPLFNLEETRTYLPRQSPRSGFAIQLGRLGVLRFGI